MLPNNSLLQIANKHIICSTGNQRIIKTTVRYHYIPNGKAQRKKCDNIKRWQGTEKLDLMQLGENKEWYRHSGKQFGSFLKKKKN